jgi:hypothetical protein
MFHLNFKDTINKWQFLLSVLAVTLVFVSLYQLEIIFINTLDKACYETPFYFLRCDIVNYDYMYWNTIWRDIYYGIIILSVFLLIYAIWKWE